MAILTLEQPSMPFRDARSAALRLSATVVLTAWDTEAGWDGAGCGGGGGVATEALGGGGAAQEARARTAKDESKRNAQR